MKKTTILLMLIAALCMLVPLSGCKPRPPVPEVTPTETIKPEVVKPTEPTQPAEPLTETLREEQLRTVYFDFDKYNLRPDAKAALDANSALLLKYTSVVIKIEGHCDERGTVEYNLSLGEKRAKSVADYLYGLGVDASRVSIISYGKERPVDAGHSEDSWSQNRRAEFRVVSQ